jgi:Na+/H+ antiporter NhaC
MELTDWIVILAIALLAIAFFCTRTPANWSQDNRARRLTGTRMLVQAACSLWAALLIVVRGLFAIDGLPGVQAAPVELLTGVAFLIVCGCYWSIRGSKLLKPRRLFATQ